jgi:membrane protein YdbS with pleckstrin-like domain
VATFQSKYDAWLVVLAGSAVPAMLWSAVSVWTHSGAVFVQLLASGAMLCGASLMVWTLRATRYVVDPATLHIQCGPFRWSVPLASIRSVEPTRDTTSGPAWSLDRLSVIATDRTILISPRDKVGFLDALHANDPGLRRDGGRLVRSA